MKLEEIEVEWEKDAHIDQLKLAIESARVPILHSKYYKYLIREVMMLRKKEDDLNILMRDRRMYFTDTLTDEELKVRGWKRIDLKILKPDVDRFIDSDSLIIDSRISWTMQDEKVSFLKSIMASINSRNYTIKNIIDWKKFESGG